MVLSGRSSECGFSSANKTNHSIGRRIVSLSKEGEIEIYSNKTDTAIVEKIPEAGLRLGTRGYVSEIREIGDSLYVCGFADQVYKKAARELGT